MSTNEGTLEPLLSLQLYHDPAVYRPGDVMRFDYQVDAIDAESLAAIEASVLWITEGKGDEDFGIHHFERRVQANAPDSDLRALHVSKVTLPETPLSYSGEILHIRWLVRVRIFVKGGKEHCIEKPFVLSSTAKTERARLVPHED